MDFSNLHTTFGSLISLYPGGCRMRTSSFKMPCKKPFETSNCLSSQFQVTTKLKIIFIVGSLITGANVSSTSIPASCCATRRALYLSILPDSSIFRLKIHLQESTFGNGCGVTNFQVLFSQSAVRWFHCPWLLSIERILTYCMKYIYFYFNIKEFYNDIQDICITDYNNYILTCILSSNVSLLYPYF